MLTLARYHNEAEGVFRIYATLTGRNCDAVWVNVTRDSYWQQWQP